MPPPPTSGTVLIPFVLSMLGFTSAPSPWVIGPFDRPAGVGPVLRPDPASTFDCPVRGRPVHWEAAHTFNPAAVLNQGNHRLPRLAVATSPDLLHWTKHGPAFAADTPYARQSTKSGAILGRPRPGDGQVVAAQVDGHYWMYWGEGDVKLARSDDLVRWTVVETAPGHPLAVLPRRPGHFDSDLAEGGPPPVLTDRGIVVVYTGKNAGGGRGDPALPAGAYAAGQALFDPTDPRHLLDRPAGPFYRPTEPFERSGQYAAGTTFAEGLVRLHDRWFLYYGCADSLVAVAATT